MKEHTEALSLIRREKLIAILRGLSREDTLWAAEALIRGGVKVLEFPFDHTGKEDAECTAEKIRRTAERFGDRVLVGCGTALTPEEVDASVQAGGRLVVMPAVDAELIRYAKSLGQVVIPGALTPTEILTAWKAGADLVKLYPGGEMGLSYVKALQGPLDFIPLCLVGHICPEEVGAYLEAGVCCFGAGSFLLPKEALAEKDGEVLRLRAERLVKALSACKTD